ncbi:MAG: FGGY-family carbohydrate kinase [Chitinophagaceae bacterium]
MSIPVIAVFDAGKTNKKLLLFNKEYKIVHEETVQFTETKDENNFPCEDLNALTNWIKNSFDNLLQSKQFNINAINFCAYGASLVHVDESGKPITPLYNYLKPYPQKLKKQFYETYGGENLIALQTASPALGSLNSGLQLYRLKYEKPNIFRKIKYSLHLPQYLSYLISGKIASDITSIGCHTQLWDFEKNDYHYWVYKENLHQKFAPINNSKVAIKIACDNKQIHTGIGLHDSSAALIPYVLSFTEPFILISTGTWCVSLNPFNHSPLTIEELEQDCLFYFSYKAKPVKASRLFAGNEHEEEIKKLAVYFNKSYNYFTTVKYDIDLLENRFEYNGQNFSIYNSYEHAYHHLIQNIILKQAHSTNLILKNTEVKKIFVDGGFSSNSVYMHLLAKAFATIKIYAASVPQASALGAAMAIHKHWNKEKIPADLIKLKYFPADN